MTHRIDAARVLDLSGPVAVLVTAGGRRPIGAGRAMFLATMLEGEARDSAIEAVRAWGAAAAVV